MTGSDEPSAPNLRELLEDFGGGAGLRRVSAVNASRRNRGTVVCITTIIHSQSPEHTREPEPLTSTQCMRWKSSSTQSSPCHPLPASTLSAQCWKCFAGWTHSVVWHCSRMAGAI